MEVSSSNSEIICKHEDFEDIFKSYYVDSNSWTDEQIIIAQDILSDYNESDTMSNSDYEVPLKVGKWCASEKKYSRKLASAFKSGIVWAEEYDGISLLSFLAKKLNRSSADIVKNFMCAENDLDLCLVRPGELNKKDSLGCQFKLIDMEAKVLAEETVHHFLRESKCKRKILDISDDESNKLNLDILQLQDDAIDKSDHGVSAQADKMKSIMSMKLASSPI
mmetsp:Transcript_13973/g.14064  ORF Transcript_13973/g.14064 Transcript_13973/m.14064 type:complete len:221 (+) Transcript_13973:116-778(+)|eukprot:CAMPEP_0182429226 /NCGR_PEP_ID=MMETSP1167-20130531/25607_1 /TAXON_ID=2988 /ORGANISM="Mallomonas Sp, Strain CCMP3275" /LENGTH=220 /DNA_ID=CAMNT_0024612619 /DNA_START=104 /DNA_END=766 /DNA_ORIENTATION=-